MDRDEGSFAPHPVLTDYYDEPRSRSRFVRNLFDESAPWYDWIVRASSFGSGARYRREALERHGLRPGMSMLDVATGTGVVAEAARASCGDDLSLFGADVSIGMLQQAKTKNIASLVQTNGQVLPYADASFDFITVGFALRHFDDLAATFAEFRRVLRPGGAVLVLEITRPESAILKAILGAYMGVLLPAIVRIRTNDRHAVRMMRYYWDTTRHCVPPETILESMKKAGLGDVKRNVLHGVFSEYTGRVV